MRSSSRSSGYPSHQSYEEVRKHGGQGPSGPPGKMNYAEDVNPDNFFSGDVGSHRDEVSSSKGRLEHSEVPSSPVWHDGAGASGGRTSQRRQPRVVDYTEDFDPDNPRGMWVTSSGRYPGSRDKMTDGLHQMQPPRVADFTQDFEPEDRGGVSFVSTSSKRRKVESTSVDESVQPRKKKRVRGKKNKSLNSHETDCPPDKDKVNMEPTFADMQSRKKKKKLKAGKGQSSLSCDAISPPDIDEVNKDPNWQVVKEDLPYYRSRLKRPRICDVCFQGSHSRNKCRLVISPCPMCGQVGHGERKCQSKALLKGDYWTLRQFRHMYHKCRHCGSLGHVAQACTNHWRQFHNTTASSPSLQRLNRGGEMNNDRVFCFNCGSEGHVGFHCGSLRTPNSRLMMGYRPFAIKYSAKFNPKLAYMKPFPEFEKIDKVSSPETSFYDEEDDVPLQPIALGDKREIPTRFPVASQQAGPSLLSQRSTQQSIEATTSNSIGGGNVPANSGSSRTKVASRIEESNSQSSSTAENQRRIESFLEDLMKAQADKTEKPEISKQGKSGPSSCDDVSLSSSSQQPCPARPDSTTTRKSTATESVDVSVDLKRRSTETSPAEEPKEEVSDSPPTCVLGEIPHASGVEDTRAGECKSHASNVPECVTVQKKDNSDVGSCPPVSGKLQKASKDTNRGGKQSKAQEKSPGTVVLLPEKMIGFRPYLFSPSDVLSVTEARNLFSRFKVEILRKVEGSPKSRRASFQQKLRHVLEVCKCCETLKCAVEGVQGCIDVLHTPPLAPLPDLLQCFEDLLRLSLLWMLEFEIHSRREAELTVLRSLQWNRADSGDVPIDLETLTVFPIREYKLFVTLATTTASSFSPNSAQDMISSTASSTPRNAPVKKGKSSRKNRGKFLECGVKTASKTAQVSVDVRAHLDSRLKSDLTPQREIPQSLGESTPSSSERDSSLKHTSQPVPSGRESPRFSPELKGYLSDNFIVLDKWEIAEEEGKSAEKGESKSPMVENKSTAISDFLSNFSTGSSTVCNSVGEPPDRVLLSSSTCTSGIAVVENVSEELRGTDKDGGSISQVICLDDSDSDSNLKSKGSCIPRPSSSLELSKSDLVSKVNCDSTSKLKSDSNSQHEEKEEAVCPAKRGPQSSTTSVAKKTLHLLDSPRKTASRSPHKTKAQQCPLPTDYIVLDSTSEDSDAMVDSDSKKIITCGEFTSDSKAVFSANKVTSQQATKDTLNPPVRSKETCSTKGSSSTVESSCIRPSNLPSSGTDSVADIPTNSTTTAILSGEHGSGVAAHTNGISGHKSKLSEGDDKGSPLHSVHNDSDSKPDIPSSFTASTKSPVHQENGDCLPHENGLSQSLPVPIMEKLQPLSSDKRSSNSPSDCTSDTQASSANVPNISEVGGSETQKQGSTILKGKGKLLSKQSNTPGQQEDLKMMPIFLQDAPRQLVQSIETYCLDKKSLTMAFDRQKELGVSLPKWKKRRNMLAAAAKIPRNYSLTAPEKRRVLEYVKELRTELVRLEQGPSDLQWRKQVKRQEWRGQKPTLFTHPPVDVTSHSVPLEERWRTIEDLLTLFLCRLEEQAKFVTLPVITNRMRKEWQNGQTHWLKMDVQQPSGGLPAPQKNVAVYSGISSVVQVVNTVVPL
jgi:hypothetical protein